MQVLPTLVMSFVVALQAAMQVNLYENDEGEEIDAMNHLLQHLPLLSHLALLTFLVDSKFIPSSLHSVPLAGSLQVPLAKFGDT